MLPDLTISGNFCLVSDFEMDIFDKFRKNAVIVNCDYTYIVVPSIPLCTIC